MKIKLATVYVSDQDQALRFYTEVLGFVKKGDFTKGPYRWLTVASAEDPEGCELQLALNNDPAAKAFQTARFEQKQPPTDVTGSKIAMVNDGCGNLVQLTQLVRWTG